MDNNYNDIAKTLKEYPPHRLCDEFRYCTDKADREMRDLYCEYCDFYWDLVEFEENEKQKRGD